jgi:hypothetical protein
MHGERLGSNRGAAGRRDSASDRVLVTRRRDTKRRCVMVSLGGGHSALDLA